MNKRNGSKKIGLLMFAYIFFMLMRWWIYELFFVINIASGGWLKCRRTKTLNKRFSLLEIDTILLCFHWFRLNRFTFVIFFCTAYDRSFISVVITYLWKNSWLIINLAKFFRRRRRLWYAHWCLHKCRSVSIFYYMALKLHTW